MNIRIFLLIIVLAVLRAEAQSTAFTYQGRLNDGDSVATGLYDLSFTLYDAATNGAQQGNTITNFATSVSNGLFTVTLDFGNRFPGAARWLELGVCTNGSGAFVTLSPRQPLAPTPYAITAENVLSGGLPPGTYTNAFILNNPANQFSGVFTGNGANVTNVNAATLNGFSASNFWKTNGNTGANPTNGAFLGTLDNMPLELRVDGSRVFRIEPTPGFGVPNIIAFPAGNMVFPGVGGAVICGGTGNTISSGSTYGAVVGGQNNKIGVNATNSMIGGGYLNTIQTNLFAATISGGQNNLIQGTASSATISGGYFNVIQFNSYNSTIGGGSQNMIQTNAPGSTIAGGWLNTIASGQRSTIGGGYQNWIQPNDSATIAGGVGNVIQIGAVYSLIAAGFQNLIKTSAVYSVIGGGATNTIGMIAPRSTISGGAQNTIQNFVTNSTIGGGFQNTNFGSFATIPGGSLNAATNYAFAAGFRAKATNQGAFVWGDSTPADVASTNADSMTVRASGGVRFFSDTNLSAGVFLASDGTSWASMSDRNAKKDFAAIDSVRILEQLAVMPITHWHYRWEPDNKTPHIGPMAQDFKTAFYPGTDDKSITTQEFDGIELAAIQGLNKKVEDKSQKDESRLKKLESENAELRQTVDELKSLVQRLDQKLDQRLQ